MSEAIPASRPKPRYRKVKAVLSFISQAWTSPLMVTFFLASSATKKIVMLDVKRWLDVHERGSSSPVQGLLWLLSMFPEFRSLYYYRLRKGSTWAFGLAFVLKTVYRDCSTLLMNVEELGPGLMIQHGLCTLIGGYIGANCWIAQEVTIGYSNDTDRPTIGNNVVIAAGAKILGNVTIGDNVIIGANAVVVKNVPSNCTVVGVPAYIIRKDGVRVKEPLV
jgi:serine O-acetyltransferase